MTSGLSRRILPLWFVVAVAFAAVPWALDYWRPEFSGRWPVTANLVASIALLPAEFLVVYVVLERWIARSNRRRWAAVANELREAIGGTWQKYREILVYRYNLENPSHVQSRIDAARAVWTELGRQQDAQPEDVRGSEVAAWNMPDGYAEAVDQVAVLWIEMFPAGLLTDLNAHSRRLTRVLIPRMSNDDPGLTSAARRLIDAMADLEDLHEQLEDWNEPFIPSWSSLSDEASGIIGWGEPQVSLSALDLLQQMHTAGAEVVAHGDRLMARLVA